MSHTLTFKVTVQLDRTEGKFASREELADELVAQIEASEPYGVSGVGADGMSEYEVSDYQVEWMEA